MGMHLSVYLCVVEEKDIYRDGLGLWCASGNNCEIETTRDTGKSRGDRATYLSE